MIVTGWCMEDVEAAVARFDRETEQAITSVDWSESSLKYLIARLDADEVRDSMV